MNWYKKIAKKWKEHIPGGKADGKKPSDYERSQVERGKAVEFEHTNDPDTAREISMDHLEEHKDYYIGLEHMENMLEDIEEREKRKTAGAPRYPGQLQGDEQMSSTDLLNERIRDNELLEGEEVRKLRDIYKSRDWTQFNMYVQTLRDSGFGAKRIDSMITRAMHGIRL